MLPLLSVRAAVTFSAKERHRLSAGTKLYCLVTEAHACEQLAQGCYLEADRPRFEPATFRIASERSTVQPHRPLVVTLVASKATTGLQDRTNNIQSHDHVDSSIPEWADGYSHPCLTDSPLVYSPTAYRSLHPIGLSQTISLLHLTNCVELPTSQHPVQSIAGYFWLFNTAFMNNLSHVM